MTNSEKLFGSEEAGQDNAETKVDQPNVEQEAGKEADSTIANLVGEGKKFADHEALAKAKLASDEHIARIEKENAELRKKIESSASNYDAILEKLEQRKENNHVSANKGNQDASEVSKNQSNDVDLDKWFETKLTERERKIQEQNNVAKARQALVNAYGDEEVAKAVYNKVLDDRPYMEDAFNNLIKTDPDQFVKEMSFFQPPEKAGNFAVDPVANVQGVNPGDSNGYITWAEAKEVRKKDLKRYASKEFEDLVRKSEAYYKQKGIDYYNT